MTQTAAERTRTGWGAVALVSLAFAVAMLGTTLPTPLYPRYAAEYGFGELTTTVVFSTYAVGVVAGLLLFGHWSDQLGRRPVLLGGLLLSALAAASFLAAGPEALLYVGRLLSGVSAGIFTGTATATVIDLAPESGRGRASLVAAGVNMAGLGTGPLLAGVLVQWAPAPLRLVFVADLALVAVGAAAVLAMPEPVGRASSPALSPRALHVPAETRGVFVRAAIAGFAGFAVLGLFTAVSPAFLGQVLGHHAPALVGVVVLVIFGGSVLGQTQSARLGPQRALPIGCGVLVVGMVVVGSSLLAESLPLLVVGALVAGLGQGLSFRAALAEVTGSTPAERRGEVTSTLFTALYVGISLPVVGEGALAAATSLVTAGVVFSGLVAVLAAAALVLVLRGRTA